MKKYDIHLSAYEISQTAIRRFENLGFQRDEFANNTRCETTKYHGTYRGNLPLPDDKLWQSLRNIIEEDQSFSGGLEEEEYEDESVILFSNSHNLNISLPLPQITYSQPSPNIYKACDIHISINLSKSNENSLSYLDSLGMISFDKPKNGDIFRIFSLTCEDVEDGLEFFQYMNGYLSKLSGFVGKIKAETTRRFCRKPVDAYTLPLTNKQELKAWFNEIHKLELS